MLARTKKHHTENVELKFVGPRRNRRQAEKALAELGFKVTSDSIPWREAFPEYADSDLPGVSLRGARYKEGLTQRELSSLTGIPQRHISEMENNKRPIGKEIAKRLGKSLNVGYKVFL
jgi:DNA-binding XRE family transcriptional regulator